MATTGPELLHEAGDSNMEYVKRAVLEMGGTVVLIGIRSRSTEVSLCKWVMAECTNSWADDGSNDADADANMATTATKT